MKKLFFLFLIASPAYAVDNVMVLNSTMNPVNISGSVSTTQGPMQINTNNGTDVEIGYQINGGSVPVSVINTPSVLFSATGVNASTSSVIPLRPSQGYGRVYKQGFGDTLTGNTTIYTVTSGKTLYVQSMNISGYNTSTTNAARLRVQDGGVTVIPISGPAAGVGAATASTVMSLAGEVFLEPKQFTTSINLNAVSGTLTFSFDFTGYEE